MQKVVLSAALAGLVVFGAADVSAQTCLGTASFAGGPVRIGGGLAFADGAKQFGAQLGFGQVDGFFGGAAIGRVDIDDVDEGATSYGVSAGYQLPVGAARQAQVCPVGAFGYDDSDEIDFLGAPMNVSARTFSAGLALGAPFAAGPTTQFVPFGTLWLANTHGTVELDGVEDSDSETYGIVDLGAGFVFNQTITLRPSVSVPIGLDESDPTFGISLGFNFGGRSGAR